MTSKPVIIGLVIWLILLSTACSFILFKQSTQIDNSDDRAQMRIMAQQLGILMVRLDRMEVLSEKMLSDMDMPTNEHDAPKTVPTSIKNESTASAPTAFDQIKEMLLSGQKLPSCNSSTAERMVKDAVKNGPLSKILNLELLALKNITTKSSTEDKVECLASGLTNAGDTKLNFSFEWINKDKGQYIVQVGEEA